MSDISATKNVAYQGSTTREANIEKIPKNIGQYIMGKHKYPNNPR